ncbi:MAG: CshA/CshB family fibrillar adhesin-related protein [Pseudomonadota bacterium]|nr:CshA/CshB family fibrillar adhesin-related protein [Pseudomonadota bacterium]
MSSRVSGSFLKGAGCACLIALSLLAMPAMAADVATNCGAATARGSNGPSDYATYCWVNFAGYNQADAADANGQLYTVTLLDGGSMTFRLRVTTSAAFAAGAPSWSGAPFGHTAFLNVPGNPVLYQTTDGTTTNITLSNITVIAGAGGQVPYALVAADAESSNNDESLSFTTNGDPWTLLASMQNGSSLLFPGLAGVGTGTVTQTGVAGTVGAYAFATSGSPGTVSSVLDGGGLQGIAIGMKYLAADVRISKSHSGGFQAGGTGAYTLAVHNNGPDPYTTANTFTVTDTLPTGLTYASASGIGWNCPAPAGQLLTCTTSANLASGGDLNPITVNVNVADTAPASVDNTATVSVLDGYDYDPSNDTAIDPTPIAHPDLSGSTKDVEDVDGGLAKPGDTLRYTINVVNSAAMAATNLRVTDTLVPNLGSLSVVSIPAGATDASAGNTLEITGISLPPGGTATIVFTAVISGSAAQDDVIGNTATIRTAGNVVVGTAVADPVTVQLALPPASGNKYLYLNTGNTLTRARPATASITFAGDACFNLAPLAANLTLNSSSVTVRLRVRRSGGTQARTLRVQLRKNATGTVISGWTATQSANVANYTNLDWTFNLNAGNTSYVASNYFTLCVDSSSNTRSVQYSLNVTGDSYVRLNVATVINVNSVGIYSSAYGSTAQKSSYLQGEHAFVRAVVSDPFGNSDITAATIEIEDAAGNTQLPVVGMTSVATTASTRTYEYDYMVPTNPRIGGWTARVVAHEGSENEVEHEGVGGFAVDGRVSLGKAWVSAIPGNAVDLTIAGGTSTTPGSSTPASTIVATASAAASATLTLVESFTTGVAGDYTKGLACVRDKDAGALPLGGSGMSRTISMPNDSAVTCVFTNTRNLPLTIVKTSSVHSDPVNGTSNPKAIPGAFVDYTLSILNPSSIAVDSDSIVVTDTLPPEVSLFVDDLGGPGTGPVVFLNGSPSSGLSFAISDIAFSSDGGATWTYAPAVGGDGTDTLVSAIRLNPKGVFNPGNAAFQLRFRARIR